MTDRSARPDDARLVVRWLPADAADDAALQRVASDFLGTGDGVRVVRACLSCGSDRHGKPRVVVPPRRPTVHVSLSRSGAWAVVAATDAGPVGVDVEAVGVGATDLVAWVRHEALVKASGHGLTVDPDALDVGPTWTVELVAPPGHVAAVTILTSGPPPLMTTEEAPAG